MEEDFFNQREEILYLANKLRSNGSLKLLGLDVGRKKIGIATYSASGGFAIPLQVLRRVNIDEDVKSISKLAREFHISDLVIGVPIYNGAIPNTANYIIKLANKIKGLHDLKIYFQDESLSSCQAIESLKALEITRKRRDQIEDAAAAAIILNDFIKTQGLNCKEKGSLLARRL